MKSKFRRGFFGLVLSVVLAGTVFLQGGIGWNNAVTVQAAAAQTAVQQTAASSGTVISPGAFDYSQIPAWSGVPYCRLNGDTPYFTQADLNSGTTSYKMFSALDSLGRTGTAVECVGPDLLPTQKRGSIGQVKPSGWQTPQKKFDFIDEKYVYNRCHQIAYSLSGENANPQNLMTGTRYFNVDGMEPFELSILGYVQKTGNHVLYRATPIFAGNELEARGILLEAQSIEDGGKGIRFNAFVYNVEPGVIIDYATGAVTAGESQADRALAVQNGASTILYDEYGNKPVSSQKSSTAKSSSAAGTSSGKAAASSGNASGSGSAASKSTSTGAGSAGAAAGTAAAASDSSEVTYIVNTNTRKFHRPGCSSVGQMSSKNRLDSTESREQLISEGYSPCKRCNP